jgi:alkylation response protein AidB-like acyl-CoA dehydrogenase
MQTSETSHPLVQLAPAEAALLARVKALVAERIGPGAEQVARQDLFAWDSFRLLGREGIIATAFPRTHGGSEASMMLRVRIIEELAAVCSTSASLVTGTDLSSRPIVAGGSEALRRALLPDLASGARQSAFALTEPGAGSDVARLGARYEPAPDGGWILSGHKKFITRANVADMFVVVARQADGPEGARGLSAFVVPRSTPGITVSKEIPKLGWYGVPIAMVSFDRVRIAAGHLLGQEGRAAGALQIAAQYAGQRQVFGQPVGAHQGIQWMLAEMASRIEAARCLVYSTALRYDGSDPDVAVHASIAKLHATDLCMRVVVDCLQLLGGNGYLKAFPMERFLRDAKMNQIGEGTSEIHKTLIGRHVLRQAAESAQHPCLQMEPELWGHD